MIGNLKVIDIFKSKAWQNVLEITTPPKNIFEKIKSGNISKYQRHCEGFACVAAIKEKTTTYETAY